MESKFNLEAERKYSLSEIPKTHKISPSNEVDFLMQACTGSINWPELFNGKQILEVGAGECSFLPRILEVSRPARFVASDVFWERMEIAQQNIKDVSVEFLEANILCLPFDDNEFDLILAFGILHHIPNLEDAVSEIARV